MMDARYNPTKSRLKRASPPPRGSDCVCRRVKPAAVKYDGTPGQDVTKCSTCGTAWPTYCAGCTTDWPFAGASWCNLCTQKVQMMKKLATTPPGATSHRPMTLPENCYGEPASRRWDVEAEPATGGIELGKTMDEYIEKYPDPRLRNVDTDEGRETFSLLKALPRVVVHELIKYLPPMAVIQLANMLGNFREEVQGNKKAFDARFCPCHTEIIGNQCWRHTKNRTNLFHKLPVFCMLNEGDEGNLIAMEQLKNKRRQMDDTFPRERGTRHYGGTESWRRRYSKPVGLHEAMLAGDTKTLADMFPPGDIEGGIVHITIHEGRIRTVINNLGLLLMRIAGATITVHSIRMKGKLEEPHSDGMAEMISRQMGAACQLCIEGEQQLLIQDRNNVNRWNTISQQDWGRRRIQPIPHLLHNHFVRASLLGIEEQTAEWDTTLSGARWTGDFNPKVWRVAEPYLARQSTRHRDNPPRNGPGGLAEEFPMSYDESASLKRYQGCPRMMARPRYSPIPPVDRQLKGRRQPEKGWRYLDHYNPMEYTPRYTPNGEVTTHLLRRVRASRLGDLSWWGVNRRCAERARYDERPTPNLWEGMIPVCTDIRSLLSEEDDTDEEMESRLEQARMDENHQDADDEDSGEDDDPGTPRETSPHTHPTETLVDDGEESNGYFTFPVPEVAETPEAWEAMSRELRSESDDYSDTEPESKSGKVSPACESRGSSETEPGSPAAFPYQPEERGEPSKIKQEASDLPVSVKNEGGEPTYGQGATGPATQSDSWSDTEEMWEYYLSSDGVTRNYYFIEYGPGDTKTMMKP